MGTYTRTKKLTDGGYSPTDPASEADIRNQIDNAIQEVLDLINAGKIDISELTTNRKLSATGDFTGTWNGVSPTLADPYVSAKVAQLENGVTNAPTIGFGMNTKIASNAPISQFAKFVWTGKDLTNKLGRDGNCEDISKFTSTTVTPSLDSTNKIFGSNGIKLTLTSTLGYISKLGSSFNLDTTKYYLFSAYLKNGNATNIQIWKTSNGGGVGKASTLITDNTKFTRVGVILQPSDLNVANEFTVYVNGANGQYAYVDGIMVNEITSAEYALGASAILNDHPYIDSYGALTNPYAEIKHDNLVRNGNGEEGIGYWIPYDSYAKVNIVNGKFQLVTTQDLRSCYQRVRVKANTNYYLKGNVSGNSALYAYSSDMSTQLLIMGNGTFNSGSNTEIAIFFFNSVQGTGTADSIHLIEGTVAPPSYLPCRIERQVAEVILADGDTLTVEGGVTTGLLWWKHKTLFGKDYDWQYNIDYTGFKSIVIPTPHPNSLWGVGSGHKFIKYDGKILIEQSGATSADSANIGGTGATNISVADSDSGWAEAIAPNNDEVKCFMNGWKAIYNNGARYVNWVSAVDGSVPSGAVQSTVSATTNTTTITVASGGTNFVAGDIIDVVSNTTGAHMGAYVVTGTPTATSIPVTASANVTSGYFVVKCDNGTSNISLLTWCKNNIAPNYQGYQLHYKLANPEPISDVNCHLHGDIPKIDNGDNYVYVDSGIVLNETVPMVNNAVDYWFVNDTRFPSGFFKNKDESIIATYKNQVFNTDFTPTVNLYGNGNYTLQATPLTKVDANATYTVDYKILATMAPNVGSMIMSYPQDVFSAISGNTKAIENRQTHDVVFDDYLDRTKYEKASYPSLVLPWFASGTTTLFVTFTIPFTVKKSVVPRVSYSNMAISKGLNFTDVLAKFKFDSITILQDKVILSMRTDDSTTITDIKAYGVYGSVNIVADCKGVI